MALWDLSKRGTLRRMRIQAAHDAVEAVLVYWPHGQPEASPDMPWDLDTWADQLAIRFLGSNSLALPAWAYGTDEATVREQHRLMDAYSDTCAEQLASEVAQRIRDTHHVPHLRAPQRRTNPRRRTQPQQSPQQQERQRHDHQDEPPQQWRA